MTSRKHDMFLRLLRKCKGMLGQGFVLAGCFRLVAGVLIFLLVYGCADLAFALSSYQRWVVNVVLLLCAGGCLLKILWDGISLSYREVADYVDKYLDNRRKDILSAYELRESENETASPLKSKLINETCRTGELLLTRMTRHACWVSLKLRKKITRLLVLSFGVCALALCLHSVSVILVQRILFPFEDVPPYSNYSFVIAPEVARVIYGRSIDLSVEIRGGEISDEVVLLSRSGNAEGRTVCFRESKNKYVHHVENVVSPIDFCFSYGQARSRWQTLEVMLEPQVTRAQAQVTPPKYSRLDSFDIEVGEEPLEALSNSMVNLVIDSNRPLSSGILKVMPLDDSNPHIVMGSREDTHRLSFNWQIDCAANIEVKIFDTFGTANQESINYIQTVVPDEVPKVIITEPTGFAIATPDTELRIEGEIDDDIGVDQVDLLRAISGYRDRAKLLVKDNLAKHFEYSDKIALGELGVEPGQTLEFYLEARDYNPNLMGLASSDILRIRIISVEDYKELLRSRTTIAEMRERFNLALRELDVLSESVKEMDDVLSNPDLSSEKKKNALKEMKESQSRLTKILRQLADDLPLYDFENEFQKQLDGIASEHEYLGKELAQYETEDPGLKEFVKQLSQRLNKQKKKLENSSESAEQFLKAAKLLAEGRRLTALIKRQEDLVSKLNRYDQEGINIPSESLKLYARYQEDIRKNLKGIVETLENEAMKMSEDEQLRELFDSAMQLARKIEKSGVDDDMKQSVLTAKKQNGLLAYRYSALALEKLKKLIEGKDCMSGVCQGMSLLPSFKDELGRSLEQFLKSLSLGSGGGGMGSSGLGLGGSLENGFSQGEYSALNIPAYGPGRNSYRDVKQKGKSKGKESAYDSQAVIYGDENEELKGNKTGKDTSSTDSLSRVPSEYLDAMKRYFSEE